MSSGKWSSIMDGFWDDRFSALATYNAERERGILHSDEWKQKMEAMQKEYNEKLAAWAESLGAKALK